MATSRKLPRIGGCFACALDGCFGSHDAALNEPYVDGGAGVLYYDDEKVANFCKEANRAGLQIELHAIGDQAFDQACRALKAALEDSPRADHRHGIIHDCLPTEEGIRICRDYHIQMPVQSAFIGWEQEPDAYLETILGQERLQKLNPIRTFRDNGIVVSFGSDAPCTTPDPISDYSARWEPLVRRTGNRESGHSETAAPGAGSQQPGAGFYGIVIRSAPDPVHILHALSGSWQDPSERYLSYRHHA